MLKKETVIIIPNFNGKTLLKTCLDSLEKQTYRDFFILVVDDGSTDNSLTFLKENYPHIHIVQNDTNIGFSKSISKGIQEAEKIYQPTYIALLNNDTETDSCWLEKLVVKIEESPDTAAAASNMLFYDERNIVNSHGCMLTPFLDGEDINRMKEASKVTCPSSVLGCCFGAALIRSSALKDIGMPDERYHSYAEDTDWGWRANILGYKILFCKEAIVYHRESYTSEKYFSSYFKVYQCKKNSLCNAIKNLETKNLFKRLLLLSVYYPAFSVAYVINIKRGRQEGYVKITNLSLIKRVPFTLVPLHSIVWNLIHLKETLRKRNDIQKRRSITDQSLTKRGLLPSTSKNNLVSYER